MTVKITSMELLEEWDWETGKPAGRSVTRSESYMKGIPHEGVHLWIVRDMSASAEILFQHRAKNKALYPDCLDITVGGHVPFGLTKNKVKKEAMEEIGISPSDSGLIDLGYMRFEEKTEDYHHREFQHVYLMKNSLPLDEYSFTDGEVIGLYSVPADFIETLLETDSSLKVRGFDGSALIERTLSRKDFHPLLFSPVMRNYMDIIIKGARELVSTGKVTVRMPG
jgi:isopentenyldiphosphate isomerase